MTQEMKDAFEMGYWICTPTIMLITMFYIYWGPIKALKVGRKLDREELKRNAKLNLFLTLFSLRGSPVHVEFVDALNKIDIVFQDAPLVLESWHRLFESYQTLRADRNDREKQWELLKTDLLSAMATSLDYKELKQTDILKHYYPEGHATQVNDSYELRLAQKNYYLSGSALNHMLIEERSSLDEEKQPQ